MYQKPRLSIKLSSKKISLKMMLIKNKSSLMLIKYSLTRTQLCLMICDHKVTQLICLIRYAKAAGTLGMHSRKLVVKRNQNEAKLRPKLRPLNKRLNLILVPRARPEGRQIKMQQARERLPLLNYLCSLEIK